MDAGHPIRTRTWLVLLVVAVVAVPAIALALTANRTIAPIPTAQLQPAVRVNQAGGLCGQRAGAGPATVSHVVWIFMENKSLSTIIGNPDASFMNSLAARCGLATNYRAVTHPSLPNYIAATSGLAIPALQPFLGDCLPGGACTVAGRGMFGLVPWAAYAESMPQPCYKKNSGTYVPRHNPAVYFTGLSDCALHDVAYDQFPADLAADRLGAFTFIVPNKCSDMHDCPVATGNAWLATEVSRIVSSAPYTSGDLALFITFDEGEGARGENCLTANDAHCLVPTFVVSPWTAAGTRSTWPSPTTRSCARPSSCSGWPPSRARRPPPSACERRSTSDRRQCSRERRRGSKLRTHAGALASGAAGSSRRHRPALRGGAV